MTVTYPGGFATRGRLTRDNQGNVLETKVPRGEHLQRGAQFSAESIRSASVLRAEAISVVILLTAHFM